MPIAATQWTNKRILQASGMAANTAPVVDQCALCFTDTADSKKKRKKLYGVSSSEESKVLNKLIKKNRNDLSLESYIELKNKNAFLCYNCQKILLKLQKLLEQIDQLENDLLNKINHHHLISPTTSYSTEEQLLEINEPSQSNVCIYISRCLRNLCMRKSHFSLQFGHATARTGQKRQHSELVGDIDEPGSLVLSHSPDVYWSVHLRLNACTFTFT